MRVTYEHLRPWGLPAFTSVGCYTLIYHSADGSWLCAKCATEDLLTESPPLYVDTYDEGPDAYCDGCGKPIVSSYGDPDGES